MTKETLPTGPENQSKIGLKTKVKEIFGTLLKSMEQKKLELDKKNAALLENFSQINWNYYEEGNRYGFPFDRNDFHSIQRGDTMVFGSLKDMVHTDIQGFEGFLNYISCYPTDLKDYVTLEINHDYMDKYETKDLEILFKNLNIFSKHVKIKFHSELFRADGSRLKMLKRFIKKNYCQDCYFDIGDKINNSVLKDLITRFTKQGKAGKVINCVIKANGKEYHSSGDYRYDFE